jgi:aryl-alcohol dehydrogenase-like predicted oxidoreductase
MQATMNRKLMAGTDLEVSEVTFGAGTAAGLMVRGSAYEQDATIARAFELGVNSFDTAYVYGCGCSEVNLGRSLETIGEPHVLTTKVSLSRHDLSSGDIEGAFCSSLDESLIRLRREQVDVLLVHNAVHLIRTLDTPHQAYLSVDDVLAERGVLSALEKLSAQGKVRYFGINGMASDVVALRKVMASGSIAVATLPFNLMNPSGWRTVPELSDDITRQSNYYDYEDVIRFAFENDVGVMAISPVAAGVLTDAAQKGEPAPDHSDRGGRFVEPGQFDRELIVADRFKTVADRFGMSLTELAYRFVLSNVGVGTIVGGFSNVSQLEEAAQDVEQGELSNAVVNAIREALVGQI